MNSFWNKSIFVFSFVFIFFGFLGAPIKAEAACEIVPSGTQFRPAAIFNDYDSDNRPIIYLDVKTTGCDGSGDLLRFDFFSVRVQPLQLSEYLIEQTNNFMVETGPTVSPGPGIVLSHTADFSIPIRLGESGIVSCLSGFNNGNDPVPTQFVNPLVNQAFDQSFYLSVTLPDCLIFAKIYKISSGQPDQVIYSVGAVNDPKLIYECDSYCSDQFMIINGGFCFSPGSSANNNSGLLPYGGTCPLLTDTTIQNVTLLDPSAGGGVTGDNSNYSTTPLAPLPGFTENLDLGGWLKSLFTILIAIAGILALIMIIVGGVTYMTSDAFGKKQDGKNYIINAIAGLILALGAWVILNTINPDLAQDLNIEIPDATLDGATKEWDNGNASSGTNICPGKTVSGGPVVQGAPWPSDSAQRSTLTSAGVQISSSQNSSCPTAGSPGCTTVYFEGTSSSVINQIVSLKNQCGNGGTCDVVVTGGSECWMHRTHGPTERKIDLRATPGLNAFLNAIDGATGNTDFPLRKTIVAPGLGSFYAEPSGSTSNTTNQHWHVTF